MKAYVPVLLASTLLNTLSCDSPQQRFESGSIQTEIADNKKESQRLIEVYNEYCDRYEAGKKNLVELYAAGDIIGYKQEYDRMFSLYETILEIEEKIDELKDESFALQNDLEEGKSQSKHQSLKNLPKFHRRSFLEHKK